MKKLKTVIFAALVLSVASLSAATDLVGLFYAKELPAIEQVRTAIASGAKLNTKDKIGITPLMAGVIRGVDPEIISELISSGADVNARNKKAGTLLCTQRISIQELRFSRYS
jgi:ankyrin repeat protein